jgi:hypothetical protein
MRNRHNIYHIPYSQMQNRDHAIDGAYFIPICINDRKHYFEEIVDSPPHRCHILCFMEQH